MKRKQVWRYYCDYCKKSSGSGSAMDIHEKHCTMNPGRDCRMCAAAERAYGDPSQHPTPELVAALGDGGKAGMAALRDLASNCPACILAAIRQSELREKDDWHRGDDEGGWWSFDFKKEAESFWADYNKERQGNESW